MRTHFESLVYRLGFKKPATDVTLGEFQKWMVDAVQVYARTTQLDQNMIRAAVAEITSLNNFLKTGKKVYKIAREFGRELAKVRLNIKSSVLQGCSELSGAYCQLPEGLVGQFYHNDQIAEVDGFYFTFDWPMVVFSFALRVPGKSEFKDEQHYMTWKLDTSEDLEVVCKLSEERSEYKLTAFGKATIKYALNCLVYISSGDPDLREFKKGRVKGIKDWNKWEKKTRFESCLSSIVVGFDYKKGRVYSVDSCTVQGHFRWQPCGVGLSQVKLIWIEEHTRSLK